jgi:hypothetical protein
MADPSDKAIRALAKYIEKNGGTTEGCVEKKDFEKRAHIVRVQSLGVDFFLEVGVYMWYDIVSFRVVYLFVIYVLCISVLYNYN